MLFTERLKEIFDAIKSQSFRKFLDKVNQNLREGLNIFFRLNLFDENLISRFAKIPRFLRQVNLGKYPALSGARPAHCNSIEGGTRKKWIFIRAKFGQNLDANFDKILEIKSHLPTLSAEVLFD